MTVVSDILSGAYNRSTRNDPGKLAQDPELTLHLNRVYQRAWPLMARARPDEFQAEIVVAMNGIPPTGFIPTDTIAVNGGYTAAGTLLTITPSTDRTRLWNVAPCVWRSANTLVSRGQVGDPMTGDLLTLLVLDAPDALVTTTSALDPRWPIRQVQLLVDYVACYLDTKDAGRDMGDRQKLSAEFAQDVQAFAAEFKLEPADVQWLHAPVERAA